MAETAFLGKAFRKAKRATKKVVRKGARTVKRTAVQNLPTLASAAGSAAGSVFGGPAGARIGGRVGSIAGRVGQRAARGQKVSVRRVGKMVAREAINEAAPQVLGPYGNLVGGKAVRRAIRSRTNRLFAQKAGGAAKVRQIATRGARRAMNSMQLPDIGAAKSLANQARKLSPEARRFLMRELTRRARFRDTQGLEEGGTVYVVESGDSLWKIAQTLTGNGANYRALMRANPQYPKNADGSNFRNVWAGMRLKLPADWVKSEESEPQAELPPVVPTLATPDPESPSDEIVAAPAPGPVELSSEQKQELKAILIAWADTDGESEPGLENYGDLDRDYGTSWTERDGFVLLAFIRWVNRTSPVSVPESSDPSLAQHAAAVSWANVRGAADEEVRRELGIARGAMGTGDAPDDESEAEEELEAPPVISSPALPPPIGAVPSVPTVVPTLPSAPVVLPSAPVAKPSTSKPAAAPSSASKPGPVADSEESGAGLALLALLGVGGAALL